MIVADALSQQSDHSTGLKEDNKHVTALPKELWIHLLDTALQDTIATAQGDAYTQEVLADLDNSSLAPNK